MDWGQAPDRWTGRWIDRRGHGAQVDLVDGQMDGCGQSCRWTDMDGGVGARWIGIEKWVGWQTNRWTDRQIGCEIDNNRWGVGQKVALGQQVGGIGGQSIVGGDGSPRWVVITRSGVCMCENSKI